MFASNKDPVTAIFEKYFYDEVSPRVHPVEHRDAWFQREIERGHVDGVLFYIPLEDDVAGLGLSRGNSRILKRGRCRASSCEKACAKTARHSPISSEASIGE